MISTWVLLSKLAAKHLCKDIVKLWMACAKAPKLWLWVVVLSTFLFVTQHSIVSLDALELGSVTTFVWMMLAGQFPKSLFDFSGCGSSGHT